MKNNITLLFLLALSITSFAQTDKDDRKQDIRDKTQERQTVAKEKVDYNLFHRQMVALTEYSDERKKIPALQKASKMPVKIVAYIDSVDDVGGDTTNKTLTGYISENVGDNSVNIYEITYDRSVKKIVAVKATGETSDVELDESTGTKKATAKKAKDDDDDDDADEDKPTKSKTKTKKDTNDD